MAEDFGVEDRGHFYDPVGALRDVVVNHLMQVVAAAAMEAPVARRPRRRSRTRRSRSSARSTTADPAHYVRGQYDGYRSIDGVAADSTTETYAALRLEIDNWRWAGVPFFIRTGKRLPVTQTELRLVFKHPPQLGFAPISAPEPNQLVVKLDPTTGRPAPRRGPPRRRRRLAHRSSSTWSSPSEGGEGATPYEVLLHAALVGDSTRFTRQDGVEEAGGSCSRCSTRRRRSIRTRPGRGARRRPTSSSPGTAAGTGPGCDEDEHATTTT